jgi:hypothetical protein
MGHDNENNRSSALTPEILAMITAATSAAVKEALAGSHEHNLEMIKELALTPEKLREATKPYKDPTTENREKREKIKFRQEEADNQKQMRLTRENCPHTYKQGGLALGIIRNYMDRQPRGICMLCHELFHPREWRIDAPTEEMPAGFAHIVAAHPKYALVLAKIRESEG